MLPPLLASARKHIRVQVMEYMPLSFGDKRSRPFYGVIDNALRVDFDYPPPDPGGLLREKALRENTEHPL